MAKVILRAGKVAIKITLPIMFLAVLLYTVKLLAPAKAQEVAGSAELLEQAEGYVVEGQYDQATAIYNSIISDGQVATPGQVLARAGLVAVSIHRGEIAAAEADLDLLLNDYDGEAVLSTAVYGVANAFSETRPAKAIPLFQQILDTWPGCDEAIWAQVEVARINLDLKNKAAAHTACQELISRFSDHEKMPEAIRTLADTCIDLSPQKAVELYQYVSTRWPDAQDAIWTQANMVRAYLKLKDDAATEAAYQNLLSPADRQELSSFINMCQGSGPIPRMRCGCR
ncbi:MAG: hypothetical protein ACYTE8_13465 [Planctomycetota bacterium]|jgi:tetratricopeptide (TPR) repeat protein